MIRGFGDFDFEGYEKEDDSKLLLAYAILGSPIYSCT